MNVEDGGFHDYAMARPHEHVLGSARFDLAALDYCCLGLAKVPGRQHVCVQSVRSSVQRGNNFSWVAR